ncbi:MAG: hypothetical protein FWD68_11010 [Alphaproteobacteria bacterium]|nr:hypothetical protein [Alphaproteobacteria bacterium]
MISEEEFAVVANCPPELAFARLHRKFRDRLEANLERKQDGRKDWCVIEYINHTLAAAQALGLDFLNGFTVPRMPDDDKPSDFNDICTSFMAVVDSYTVHVNIRHFRKDSPASVSVHINGKERKRIRACVDKIREVVRPAAMNAEKKVALLARLDAFLADVDYVETSMGRFADFIMVIARATDNAREELQPAWKHAQHIAAIFALRCDAEYAKLPRPEERCEPPHPGFFVPTWANDFGDICDIPF